MPTRSDTAQDPPPGPGPLAPIAALLSLGGPCLGAAEVTTPTTAQLMERPLAIGWFRLEPWANLTYRDDRVRLHPKGLLGIGYDSNPKAVEDDPEGDVFVDLRAGSEMGWYLSDTAALRIDAELTGKRYIDTEGQDVLGGRAEAVWLREELVWRYLAEASIARLETPLEVSGEEIVRNEYRARAAATRIGSIHEITGDLAYRRIDLGESGRGFDSEIKDRHLLSLGGRYETRSGERSRWYGEGVATYSGYDEDVLNDHVGLRLSWGWRGELRNRLKMDAVIGAEVRSYEDDFAGDDAYDDQLVAGPAALVQVSFPWRDRSELILRADTHLEDSSTSNAAHLYGGGAFLRLRQSERFEWVGELNYLAVQGSGSAAGEPVRRANILSASAAFQWHIRRGAATGISVSYTDHDENVFGGFQRVVLEVQAAVAF